MPEAARLAELAHELRFGRHLQRALRDGLRALAHVRHAGPKRGQHALVEVEVEVPGLEVLADVREVHVRAVAEVVRAQVDVAQRLVVRDRPGAEAGLLRRREAEKEL